MAPGKLAAVPARINPRGNRSPHLRGSKIDAAPPLSKFRLSLFSTVSCKKAERASRRYLIDNRSLVWGLLRMSPTSDGADGKARTRRAFFFFTLYLQYGRFGRISCQVFAGILAWKCFCISGCYFGLSATGLTRFPQSQRKVRNRSGGHFRRTIKHGPRKRIGSWEGDRRSSSPERFWPRSLPSIWSVRQCHR
jgi:hypothetical protein